jgi:flagellar basal body-associated protein FliL
MIEVALAGKSSLRLNWRKRGKIMWILILEAAIALALFLFILWWTLAPVKRREDDAAHQEAEAARRSGE